MHEGAILQKDADHFWVGLGKRRWFSSLQIERLPVYWYAPDFFLSHPAPYFTHEEERLWTKEELKKYFSSCAIHQKPIWKAPSDALWKALHMRLDGLWQEKRVEKIVPYVRWEASTTCCTGEPWIHRLLDHPYEQTGTLYGLWNDVEGMIGRSPEILASWKGVYLETEACAGTYAKGLEVDEAKLTKEHALVVDGIQEALVPLGQVSMAPFMSRSFGLLTHRVTPIRLQAAQPLLLQEVVSALHPTAALGAFPRKQGMAWLAAWNKSCPRGRFGAPFGRFHGEGGDLIVAIRNVQWKKGRMILCAGAGMVKESCWLEEKKEMEIKAQCIRTLLQL